MVLQNLLRRRTRTLLTLVGIAISIAAVVTLNAFADGFSRSFTSVLTSSGADIVVAQSDAPDVLFSVIDSSLQPQLARLPGVRQISGSLVSFITLPGVPYFFVFGLDPKEFGIGHYRVVDGRPLGGFRQMLLGRSAAETYHKQVGDYFKLLDVSFRIVGLYETGQGIEDSGAVIALREAQELFKRPDQVAYYQLKLTDPGLTEQVLADVTSHFPGLTASRSSSYADNLREIQMLRAFGFALTVLAALVGGLGMMNTMLMSVFERTREIGMLRAVGWRRRRVLGMILGEAMLLSLPGGLIGCGLGALATMAVNRGPILSGFLDGTLTPALFGQALAAALALGAVGGFYPAWRAAHLQPLEAMRYDGTTGSQINAGNRRWRGLEAIVLKTGMLSALGLRNLLRQRTRTILTVTAICISAGLVTAIGGLTSGLVRQFSAMGSQRGELSITETRASDVTVAIVEDKVGHFAESLAGVEEASGLLLGLADLPGTARFLIYGLEPGSFWMRQFVVTEGRTLRSGREMLLGRVAATNLDKQVGDSLKIHGVSYRVVGVYETGIPYQDLGGVLTLAETQSLLKRPNQVSMYALKLANASYAETVQRRVEARFPDVSVTRSSEGAENANFLATIRAATDALALVAILIGAVGLMNTMLMSVLERTREIGTLRAVGWRRRRVVSMVLRESLLASIPGGLGGVVVGIALIRLMSLEPAVGAYLAGAFSPLLVVQSMLMALGVGALGALYPAWKASNQSPIEALRYE